MNKKIAITIGDFNGIGPEITVKALNKLVPPAGSIVIVGSKDFLTGLKQSYKTVEIPYEKTAYHPGIETKEAGEFSYKCLKKACEMAKNMEVQAIVTAPVSKNALHLAGYNFSGQTEIIEKELANLEKNEKAEMLFVSKDLRVLLLTRHLPLKDVKITKNILIEKIERIHRVLTKNFGIKNPRIALCSLNPHAGENGILGKDEIEEFYPAIELLRAKGVDVTNPMPADTLFAKAAKQYLKNGKQLYDVYCACYHDQGLIPVKVLAMDETVNMTVGLSIIRTSPAHGTAYDIAAQNIADENSMICAIEQAISSLQAGQIY